MRISCSPMSRSAGSARVLSSLTPKSNSKSSPRIEDRVVDLVEEAYDLVIRINPSPEERLVGRCFLNDERLIVAAPDVPRPCPTTEGEDVIVKSVLLGRRPTPALWRMRSAAEKDIVLKPEPVLRLSSLGRRRCGFAAKASRRRRHRRGPACVLGNPRRSAGGNLGAPKLPPPH